jgi:anoctamin-10
VITWIGALTNASLVHLFQPQTSPGAAFLFSPLDSVEPSIMNATIAAVDNGIFSSFALSNINLAVLTPDPYQSVRSTLFSSLLVALASEHAYILARMAVRHIIDRAIWRASPEEATLRRGAWQFRRVYLASAEADMRSKEAATSQELASRQPDEADVFWRRPDQGLAEIRREGKLE